MAHVGRPAPVYKNEIVPQSAKIADITEADTNPHTITLDSLGLPANCVALFLNSQRIAGTGYLNIYPASAALPIRLPSSNYQPPVFIPVVDGELKYALTVINDDFDVYIFGFITQRRRRY